MNLKKELQKLCLNYVNKRCQTLETIIKANKKALQNETKSSAGDKHETGRAMLQLEMEKTSKQFLEVLLLKETLAKINVSKTSTKAHLGSLIYTNKNIYFLSISVGLLVFNNVTYFAISTSSPIGKLLLGKQEKDIVLFNGSKIEIQKIV